MDSKEAIKAMIMSFKHDVLAFHDKIGLPIGTLPARLTAHRKDHKLHFLLEELNEYRDSVQISDEVDALIDLMYVAIGTLIEMGVTPYYPWDQVHEKNMQKMKGTKPERPDSEGNDAVKPAGWTPPDHGAILQELALRAAVSPGLLESTRVRIIRSAKYNQGRVKLVDHFPLGAESYFQMIWTKAIRLRSLMESRERDEEAIWDTLRDESNYNSFWMEDETAWSKGQRWGSE